MSHINSSTHPVDLDDGTVVPPLGVTDGVGDNPHDQALVADGVLIEQVDEKATTKKRGE